MSIWPAPAGSGGAQRTPVPGMAGGISADRPARRLQLLRGVHPHRRFDVQPARQVAQSPSRSAVAPARRITELSACPRTCGSRTTTAFRIRTPASLTMLSTRRPKSSGSTCPRTPTPSWPSWTTACAPGTTSTSWSAANNPRLPGSPRPKQSTTAGGGWASGTSPARKSPVKSPTSFWPARATSPPSKQSRRHACSRTARRG